MIPGQISLLEITQPPWIHCFKTCKHFDSHPDFPPDHFAWPPDMLRCTYCDHEYGTSGKQFRHTSVDHRVEIYCVHYEEKE